MSINKLIDGPIPGANYTSDTRNYPWHRPPDLTGYDEIIDYLITKFSSTKSANSILALLEFEMDVASLVSTMLLSSVGKGKFSVDMALLVAGPFARYVEIMAKSNGIKKIEMGIEDNEPITTVEDLKMMAGVMDEEELAELDELGIEEPTQEESRGLMGMPIETGEPANTEEQENMLGQNQEEPIENEVV